MFDIGFWELLVMAIVALLVLGPERLPSAVRSTVKTVRTAREMANGFKQEVSHQLKISELHEHLKEAEQSGLGEISEDVKRSVNELKAAAESVQEPYATTKQTIKQHTSKKITDPLPSDNEQSIKKDDPSQ